MKVDARLFWSYFILGSALFICTIALSSCYKTATDDGEAKRGRFTGAGAWSVNGITVGQALAVVEDARGKSNKPPVITTAPVYIWPDGVTVAVDKNNQVQSVYGNTLNIGAASVVSGSISSAQTQQLLGDGKEKVFRSPKGGGVISTGYVVSGKTLSYERDGAFFVFNFNKSDQLTGVLSQPHDPNKKP